MKKNTSKIISITMSSLFILSSTVTLGIIGYAPRKVAEAPLSSLEETLVEENSPTLATTDDKDTADSVVEETPKTVVTSDSTKNASTFSRGGTNPYSYTKDSNSTSQAEKSTSKENVAPKKSTSEETTSPNSTAKVEVLDWWKSASSVFAVGSVATVKDVYTGKTFKVKRTMGTNHSDTEALTKEDTEIIKSIWGGFSWERRPIHIYINGRVLAASMSAMPHAGIDSAPAYDYVENRSEGYGAGSNLDVVKNNGMDGHFDIHFLNSTRHKDGQPDPQHQAAIKVAAGK